MLLRNFVFGPSGSALLDHIADGLAQRAKVKEDAINAAQVEREGV
jgi:hypothetical protein